MQTEFRNRAFLPVAMPLAILGVIAAVAGLFALILLYSTREIAVALALAAAAGILVAISLAASRDELAPQQVGAVGLAAGTPVLIGVLLATGVVGGIDDADRRINVEPHGDTFVLAGIVPNDDGEEPPLLAAEDASAFCLPDGGSCTPTNEWSFEYGEEEISYAFDNRDAVSGPHNLQIWALPDRELSVDDGAISLNDLEAEGQVITPEAPEAFAGPAAETYRWSTVAEEGAEGEAVEIPEQAYFICTIHPSAMWGVVTLTPAA